MLFQITQVGTIFIWRVYRGLTLRVACGGLGWDGGRVWLGEGAVPDLASGQGFLWRGL